MNWLLVPNVKTATILLSKGASIEAFNKQDACLSRGTICLSSMEFWSCVSEVLSCLFFPLYSFSYGRNVSFFLCPKIRHCLSCNMLHKRLLTVWSDDLERGFLWSLFWGFDGSPIECLKCLNYKMHSCVFFVNWNTILRRNLREFPGCPVVRTLHLHYGAQVPFLVPGGGNWDPESHTLHSAAKKKEEKKREGIWVLNMSQPRRGALICYWCKHEYLWCECLCICMSAFVLNYISLMFLCLQSCHTSEMNILLYWKYWGSLIYSFIHTEFQGISIG